MIDREVISRDFMRSAAFFDVAQVEVLRGPQGTAFGRNATAGVVHLRTQRPKFDPSAVRPGLGILDARLTWRSLSERFSVSVWGRNLTDKAEVLAAGFDGIFSQRPRIYSEPRTIGASLSIKLGG